MGGFGVGNILQFKTLCYFYFHGFYDDMKTVRSSHKDRGGLYFLSFSSCTDCTCERLGGFVLDSIAVSLFTNSLFVNNETAMLSSLFDHRKMIRSERRS